MRTAATAPGRWAPRFLVLCGFGFLAGFAAGAWSVTPDRRHPAALPETPATVAAPTPAPSPPPVPPAPRRPSPPPPARGASASPAEVAVRRGDTLLGILGRAGVATQEAHAAVATLRKVANLRALRPGQRLAVELDGKEGADRRLVRLVWPQDAAREIHLVRGPGGGFKAESVDRPLTRELFHAHGAIEGSLYLAGGRAGLPPPALAEMIALLSFDLDLQREIHPGDRFEAVLERRLDAEGKVAAVGELLFVGLDARERAIAAYRFTGPDGRTGYYDREGRALRKWLLRTPVDGARLSSPFGPRRHPILGYTRLHRGLDFAAPTGTPVLAAGDGVVEFVGRDRGYGNHVRIRHNAAYATAYAHLSRFAKGLARGDRVRQGQVIGRVGSTGLSTGPHLHYEVLHRGEAIDPMSLRAAFTEELEGEALRRFRAQRDRIDALRGKPGGERLVAQRGS